MYRELPKSGPEDHNLGRSATRGKRSKGQRPTQLSIQVKVHGETDFGSNVVLANTIGGQVSESEGEKV